MNLAIEKLHNNGIAFFGDKRKLSQKQKTLIVLGVARGGTSVISGTLDCLGVFTGERSREPVYEDVLLAEAIEKSDTKEVQAIIEKYDDEHTLWSFKRPSLIDSIEKIHPYFHNPIYLIIFKDIFAIANRNNISMKQNMLIGIEKAQNDYGKIVNFLKGHKELNYFTFSYEKIMQKKELFVDTLVDLVGRESINQDKIQQALDFIEPNPSKYLDISRNTKSAGKVEEITPDSVKGWGKYVLKDEPAMVELWINDKVIKSMIADNQHKLQDGYGFTFDLSDVQVEEKDEIAVKFIGDVLFLNGSRTKNTSQTLHKQLWFNQNQLESMLGKQYYKPDFLRDIAVLLRDKGDMGNAYKIISKALELRPQGPVIAKLKEEIGELI